jgi:RNA polymerase sigma-70 factor (ECF subfamily)
VGETELVIAAQGGDGTAFAELVERHRRELRVHCYRLLGSFDEAEDLVQETFLRAWRKRRTFEGRSTFRAWLYRIATNACLDFLDRHPRRPGPSGEITWLGPFPDQLLDEAVSDDEQPDALVVSKETIELVYIVAIQHLPPRQRAVLAMRDVLGWPSRVTAEALDLSVPAVKSALQRARGTLRQQLPAGRLEWAPAPAASDQERALLKRYREATERTHIGALADLLARDARLSMPAWSEVFVGREGIVAGLVEGGFGSAELTWERRSRSAGRLRRSTQGSASRLGSRSRRRRRPRPSWPAARREVGDGPVVALHQRARDRRARLAHGSRVPRLGIQLPIALHRGPP